MPDPVIPATPDIVVTVCYALSGNAVLTVDPKLARQRRVEKQRREKPDRWIRR